MRAERKGIFSGWLYAGIWAEIKLSSHFLVEVSVLKKYVDCYKKLKVRKVIYLQLKEPAHKLVSAYQEAN